MIVMEDVMRNEFSSGIVAFLSAQKRGIADVSDLHRKLDGVIDAMVFEGELRRVGDGMSVELVAHASAQRVLPKRKSGGVAEVVSQAPKSLIALSNSEYRIYSFVRGVKDGVLSLQELREKSLNAGVSSEVFDKCLGALSGKEALIWNAATNSYKFNSGRSIQVVSERNAKIHRQEGFREMEQSSDVPVVDEVVPQKPIESVGKPLTSKEIGDAVVRVFDRCGGSVIFSSLIKDLVNEKVLPDNKPSSQIVVAKKLRDMKDVQSRPLFCLAVEDVGRWNRVDYSSNKEKEKVERSPVVATVKNPQSFLESLVDEKVVCLMKFMLRRLIDEVPKRSFLYELENVVLIRDGDVAALDATMIPLVRHKILVAEGPEKYVIQRDVLERFRATVEAIGHKKGIVESSKKKAV